MLWHKVVLSVISCFTVLLLHGFWLQVYPSFKNQNFTIPLMLSGWSLICRLLLAFFFLHVHVGVYQWGSRSLEFSPIYRNLKINNRELMNFIQTQIKLLFVITFLHLPSLLDLISTASNLRSDTGLRSWLAFLNSDSRDFAFFKRKKLCIY